ncbi:MAG: hypothetical protein ACPLVJ_00630 [Candidatus Bathyarchaeales archaeon]
MIEGDFEFLRKIRARLLKVSNQMTGELKKALVGKTIKDIEVLKDSGDIYIQLATDKGPIVIGATELGVWIDKPERFNELKREMQQTLKNL